MIYTYKSYKHLIIFTYFLKNNVLFSFGVIVQLIAYLHAILCKSPSIVNQYNFSELPETKTARQLLMGTPKWVFHVKLPMTTTNTFFGREIWNIVSCRNGTKRQQQQQNSNNSSNNQKPNRKPTNIYSIGGEETHPEIQRHHISTANIYETLWLSKSLFNVFPKSTRIAQ